MKIGSGGSNISFSGLNIANMAEEKADVVEAKAKDAVQLNSEESSKAAVEAKSASTSRRPERLNLLAGSFVHQEADDSKYSTINLKSLRLENTLMTNFTNVIKGVMAYRSAETEKFIDAGIEHYVAKKAAFADVKKVATDAPGKMLGQATGKEVTEESKEIKEDTEKRTEEVIEKKQEEKKTEAKEAEAKDTEAKTDPENADAKVSESNPETVNSAQAVQSGVEAGSTESVASGSVGVEAGAAAAKGSASENTASSSTSAGTSKKVDVLV